MPHVHGRCIMYTVNKPNNNMCIHSIVSKNARNSFQIMISRVTGKFLQEHVMILQVV